MDVSDSRTDRTWELGEKHLVICLVIKTPTLIITHIVDQNTISQIKKKKKKSQNCYYCCLYVWLIIFYFGKCILQDTALYFSILICILAGGCVGTDVTGKQLLNWNMSYYAAVCPTEVLSKEQLASLFYTEFLPVWLLDYIIAKWVIAVWCL